LFLTNEKEKIKKTKTKKHGSLGFLRDSHIEVKLGLLKET